MILFHIKIVDERSAVICSNEEIYTFTTHLLNSFIYCGHTQLPGIGTTFKAIGINMLNVTNKWLLLKVLKFHTSNLRNDTYNVSTYKPKTQNDLRGKVSSTGRSWFRTKVTDCSGTQTCIQLSFYLLKYIAKS